MPITDEMDPPEIVIPGGRRRALAQVLRDKLAIVDAAWAEMEQGLGPPTREQRQVLRRAHTNRDLVVELIAQLERLH